MARPTVLHRGVLKVVDYRCEAGPRDRPFPEAHRDYSISYVQRGSFGYHARGRSADLVAGSCLIGRPGDEYICTHDHHEAGDDCLSFEFSPELADELGSDATLWRLGGLAPSPDLIVLAERALAAVAGAPDASLDEIGLALAAKIARRPRSPASPRAVTAAERRRAVRAALWIDHHSHASIGLAEMAREAGIGVFQFVRTFGAALGVTPHQYLVRTRIRRAARMLADRDRTVTEVAQDVGFTDLSNFVRTFRQAAGVSPRRFRAIGRDDRKILQDRIDVRR